MHIHILRKAKQHSKALGIVHSEEFYIILLDRG